MLTMWIILRRLGHSRHALIIMLCISAVRLNRGLQQPNASIVPALLCGAVKKKSSKQAFRVHFFSNGMKKDFIEVQIDCVLLLWSADKQLSARKSALAGQCYSSTKVMFLLSWPAS